MYKIAILLATYNGSKFLEEQILSVKYQLGQRTDFNIDIFARDDGSLDNTVDILTKHNVKIVNGKFFCKGAAQNFLNLICLVPIESYDFIAFSDQDDIWFPNKILLSLKTLIKNKSAGYSSSFISMNSNGVSKYSNKKGAIKDYDYIFQSPGPGCTFLIKSIVLVDFKKCISSQIDLANKIIYHDSLIYFYVRSQKLTWFIDDKPTMIYRQHSSNVLGSNFGISGWIKRFKMLNNKYFSKQIGLFGVICKPMGDCETFVNRILRFNLIDRLFLLSNVYRFRRQISGIFVLSLIFIFSSP